MNRQFDIADQDYDFLRRLVYSHSRISLGDDRKALVSARISRRLKDLRLESVAAYCRYLLNEDKDEVVALVDAISTNHTAFFREPQHFQFLEREWLVPAIGRARAERRPLRIWSAGCATGEEPYSIAMSLEVSSQHLLAPKWGVWASDISTRSLRHADQGIYELERIQLPEKSWLPRFFQRGTGRWSRHGRVKGELRDRVQFSHLNLLSESYPFKTQFDLIFCRNVMIYFDSKTQVELVNRLKSQLMDGGILVVGASESICQFSAGLQFLAPSIYRKNITQRISSQVEDV